MHTVTTIALWTACLGWAFIITTWVYFNHMYKSKAWIADYNLLSLIMMIGGYPTGFSTGWIIMDLIRISTGTY